MTSRTPCTTSSTPWWPAGSDSPRCAAPRLGAEVRGLADAVAYSVHDIEYALVAGWLDLSRLHDVAERVEVWEAVRDWYLPNADDGVLEQALRRLQHQPGWPT